MAQDGVAGRVGAGHSAFALLVTGMNVLVMGVGLGLGPAVTWPSSAMVCGQVPLDKPVLVHFLPAWLLPFLALGVCRGVCLAPGWGGEGSESLLQASGSRAMDRSLRGCECGALTQACVGPSRGHSGA